MFKLLVLFAPLLCLANSSSSTSNLNHLILMLAIVIGGAGFSWIVEKVKLPSVAGELSFGMLLAVLAHYNIGFWGSVVHDSTLELLATLGSIVLLFEVGLESNVAELKHIGKHGFIVAIIGIVLPFILGMLVSVYLFHIPDIKVSLFLAATLAATSTGISVRVFKELGIIKSPACQIVLTASIVDDVLGLVILSMVSSLVVSDSINIHNIEWIILSVSLFFLVSFTIGRHLNRIFISLALRLSNTENMVVVLLMSIALFWSYAAESIGLASIIGAFIGGLIIENNYFSKLKNPPWLNDIIELSGNSNSEVNDEIYNKLIADHEDGYLIKLLKPITYIFVPIFFVYAGMQVDLIEIANWQTLYIGGVISFIAIAGKLLCGVFLPKSINKWVVGFGMVPRGEVGLIFALAGKELGVFNDQMFAGMLMMVIVTSVVTPIFLQIIGKKK